MRALDTNALVRLIVRDDETQAKKVIALLAISEQNNEKIFVSSLVILETIWVLSSSLKKSRDDVIQILLSVLKVPVLNVEYNEQLNALLHFAKDNTFDLSDLMIVYRCQNVQALPVMTFDKRASRHELFELIK